MPFKYVGRKHSFVGHSVWDIVTSLPNYGKGRLIFRRAYMRYSEPCFMRIIEAKPKMDKKGMFGEVSVEQWFRGKYLGLLDLSKPAYKTDFRLVPKHQESWWFDSINDCIDVPKKILPSTITLPPLLRMRLEQQDDIKVSRIPLVVRMEDNLHARVAEEGDTPNVATDELDGIGTTEFPYLYEGVDLTQATYPPDPSSYKGAVVPRPANPRDQPTPKCQVYLRMLEEMEMPDQEPILNN